MPSDFVWSDTIRREMDYMGWFHAGSISQARWSLMAKRRNLSAICWWVHLERSFGREGASGRLFFLQSFWGVGGRKICRLGAISEPAIIFYPNFCGMIVLTPKGLLYTKGLKFSLNAFCQSDNKQWLQNVNREGVIASRRITVDCFIFVFFTIFQMALVPLE